MPRNGRQSEMGTRQEKSEFAHGSVLVLILLLRWNSNEWLRDKTSSDWRCLFTRAYCVSFTQICLAEISVFITFDQ